MIMEANPTLLRMKYGRIVDLYAKRAGITYEEALQHWYNSITYELVRQGISDMHCMSDEYLAEELWLERHHFKRP